LSLASTRRKKALDHLEAAIDAGLRISPAAFDRRPFEALAGNARLKEIRAKLGRRQ